ncbi:polysaccharide deacetylase family protein [Paenibacillus sp. LHD-117]|uniref:polysaccharide deacetylase family protein n=1 Tax=Paenibacillus sp. LHD-117 TaxID=3071412 RepID=UPI0027E04D02|nr:polysaccharide deacetylase family protein [Paenibacillus sp. LHD-117]MDQ6421637.1 polysaccharide deacetylase family protein [Paenibacillus sp. LHD-117]
MLKLKRCYTPILIGLAILSACSNAGQKQHMHIQNMPSGLGIKSADEIEPSVAGNMNALAGGSETTERVLRPISNYELQKKFPNIFVLRGSLQKNRIALTFDDGPDRRFTPQVLDVLKKHNVKATFFLMGSRVAGHPDITRRIYQEGHSIGNHTYWHPKLWQESIDRMRWEVTQTDAEIKKVVGYSPKLFRAPYGGLNEQLLIEFGKMKFSVIGWSADSMDWTQIDSATVQKNVLSNLHPGAIVLMHSGGHWTQDLSGMVQAVDALIPLLKREGAEFVTIPQMFNLPEKK